MSHSRLALALESGEAALPEAGRIGIYRPPESETLADLPIDRTTIIHGFRPLHDLFKSRGFDCLPEPEGEFSAAVVFVPRAKQLARSLIADAMHRTAGGPVIVDGTKTDGIDSVINALRKAGCTVSPAYAKAHGKLVTLQGCDLSEWDVPVSIVEGAFTTRAGVFSSDGADPGSVLLVRNLPRTLAGRVGDFGAGWGYLSHHVLQMPAVTECHLVEAEWEALKAARSNVTDPRARFHWADIRGFSTSEKFDFIVTNPPFHSTRASDPALGQSFIEAAARSLQPKGQLWLVANRHLPYESTLRQMFQQVTEQAGTGSYKVFCAERPKRSSH